MVRTPAWSRPAYALTFLLIGALGAWWTVLISRLVEENHQLRSVIAGIPDVRDPIYDRQHVMLVGESVTMSLLLVAMLFMTIRSALRERDQARRLEGVLAASTHELKTPIAGVKALLESIQSGVLPADRAGPHVVKGLAACSRLEHLVESMLAYQASVASQRAEPVVLPLGTWVEAVLTHRVGTVPNEVVQMQLGSLAAEKVKARPEAFRVVLENLLDNAAKYGAKVVQLRATADGARVRLEVVDDGDGFSPEVADELFEPYRRGTAGARAHGTGLGLYLSRELARGMQGDLRASSDGPGRGATFTLMLRRADG